MIKSQVPNNHSLFSGVRISFRLLRFALFLFFVGCGGSGCGDGGEALSTVTVVTGAGSTRFIVEIADTASERATGLMNRTDLDDRDGMLFIFSENTMTSFWMKDTPLSLDILFIDENSEIVFVAANTVPYSEELITPSAEFRYVLEVKAGFADASGAQAGDRVELNI